MTGRPLVTISGLGVAYRADEAAALADVSLDLRQGERLAVIGESGSGKSTLALALGGLLPSDARIDGRIDWAGGPPRLGRDIGFVFQDPGGSFDPVVSIGAQIAEVATTHLGVSRREGLRLARDLLARVRLPNPERAARAFPHMLSGGQRQRAALAAAIAAGPRLLVADEATSALDTVVQAEIVTLIDELVAETTMALLFVTHDIALAARLGDRIAVFFAGRLVELASAADLFEHPRHPYTAALIAAHIGLDGPPPNLASVEASRPDMRPPASGCHFAARCERADEACAREPVWTIDGARGLSCHHPIEPEGEPS